MLEQFHPNNYYAVYYDEEMLHVPYLKFFSSARLLLAQYYKVKYNINFSFYHNFNDFKEGISSFLVQQETKDNYRHAFFIGKTGTHAMTIIYLKENGEQGFLCADSLGSQMGRVFHQGVLMLTEGSSKIAADILKRVTDIPSYIVSGQRQADFYSCDMDAFVLGRDCCGQREGTYLLPHLLEILRNNATEKEGYLEIKLKSTFLKLSQLKAFTQQHLENIDAIMHRHRGQGENLTEFMSRYGEYKLGDRRTVPDYLRVKKIKMANMIEIQFYIEQLRQKHGDKWTKVVEKEFRYAAKIELYRQWPVTINRSRKGLYEFAKKFTPGVRNTKVEYKRSESFSDTMHSVETPYSFEIFAKQLLEIINDKKYWLYKTYWRSGTADGIVFMQNKIASMNGEETLEAQFNAIRNIALAQISRKNIFYLWTSISIEARHPMVQACYFLFNEDLTNSLSFKTLAADWETFKKTAEDVVEKDNSLLTIELSKQCNNQ